MNGAPLLKPFETLVNRNIAASTPARALLKSLVGRAFAIEVASPLGGRQLRLTLAAGEWGLELATGDATADATVTGTPLGLVALLVGRARGGLTGGGTTVSGDPEVAQSFEQLLRHAGPELEEELARLVGDTPAHYAAEAARAALAWGRRALDSLARNVGEYLTEESRDLLPRAELEVFLGGVDQVREDVDRAAARLSLLERRQRGGDR
jgi:ubiquinone biosynthesis protein UbiJ